MRLSLCMIVRDEAFFIEECLEQARPHVDEIVIVDTGSVDGTREIAERYADVLLDFEWIEDFSAARNTGLDAATGDWILVLDADERIAAEDYATLRDAMHTSEFDGFYLEQRDYNEVVLRSGRVAVDPDAEHSRGYSGYTTNRIMRLFRADSGIRYQSSIHEIVDGTLEPDRRGELPVAIHHYSSANPNRPRSERLQKYMRLMEQEVAKADDGRLLAIAGSTALYQLQDYSKAESYLRRAAELGYNSAVSLEGAAEAAYRAGETARAMDLFRSLYEQGHKTPSLCLNLANLSVRSGNKLGAVALLEECLQLGGMGTETDAVIRKNIEALSAS